MSIINVHCYKGIDQKDSLIVSMDSDISLFDVRDKLASDCFVTPDDEVINLRFVDMQSNSTNYADALIPLNIENLVPMKGVLGSGNQLILTNIKATKRPDLIGMQTTTFFNGHLGIDIFLNNQDPQGQSTNTQIGAFPPLMLTNVKPTSVNTPGIWDNVCVCVENSVVGFGVRSWGAVGYQVYIAPDVGEAIIDDDIFASFGSTPNEYYHIQLLRYSTRPQTIQILGADTAGISPDLTVKFQKVTFRTRRMTSYQKNGETFASQAMPPPIQAPQATASVAPALVPSNFPIQRSLMASDAIVAVPGGGIKPAGPIEGPPSKTQWGPNIYDPITDDPSNPMGEIVVFFFVFKSHDDAIAVINGYNAPDPTLWS